MQSVLRWTQAGFRRRLTRLVLVFGLVMGGAVVAQVATGASAFAATLTDTYPTSIAGCTVPGTGAKVTCNLKGSAQDSYFDPWGEYNRECVSYVAWMLSSVNGFTMPFHGDASVWVTKAEADGYTVNTTPAAGAVGWMSIGHVAYIQSVNSNGTVNAEDYNYNYDGLYMAHPNQAASTYQEYIHFKDLSGGGTNPPSDISASSTGLVQMQSTGFTQVFAEGANNSLVEWVDTPGNPWSAMITVAGPGTTYSEPTAVVDQSSGFTQVFAEGPNNSLDNYWDTPGQPWSAGVAAGNGTTYSAPGATYIGSTQEVEVFAEGPNNSLNFNWNFPGEAWYAQTIDGNGTTYSAPAAVYSVENGGLTQVFAEGANNSLYNMWDTSGVAWSGPGSVDGNGTTFSAPAAVYSGSNGNTQVFNVGPNNSLNSHWDAYGSPWNTSQVAGANTTYSDPTTVYSSNNGGIAQLFVQGPNNTIDSYWDSYGYPWSAGQVAGSGAAYSDPASVVIWSTGQTQVLVQGPNNSLNNYWDAYGSPWGGPGSVGGNGTTYSAP